MGVQRECMQGLPAFYLQGWAFVDPELICKESVYRACLNFICCQNYSTKLVSLIANPSWFILLLGNVRPELHTESLPSTLSDSPMHFV